MRITIPVAARDWSFDALFGGPGDMRHVLMTLADLAVQTHAAPETACRLHFTLVDIHPTSVARQLIFFLAFDDLAKEDDPLKREQLLAMLTFAFFGTIMPRSLHDLLLRYAPRALHGIEGDVLPVWLHVPYTSRPAIQAALTYWSTTYAGGCDAKRALRTILT
jgi:hypothetical protein